MTHLSPPSARSLRHCAILSAALAMLSTLPQESVGAVVYTETFPNSSAASAKNFSTIGWKAHIGSVAADFTSTTNVSSGSPAVVWTANGQGGTLAYGFSADASTGSLFWTEEIGSVNKETIESISFWSNNTNTTAALRVAIRLDNNTPVDFSDDQWFVTSSAFIRDVGTANGSSGNWATNGEFELFNFTNGATAWHDLTFTPGTALNLASVRSEDLPAGNINATGLYGTGVGLRFDTFTVTTIPEPSSLVLSTAALIGLMGIRRRRR